MIDYWQLAKDYKAGDFVQRVDTSNGLLSPFIGRVTAVHRGIGFIDVQWPFANERISAEELVKVNPELSSYLPPTLNQSYSTYDTRPVKAADGRSPWRYQELPVKFYHDLAKAWMKGASEVIAYDDLYRNNPGVDDDILRGEVAKFYQVSARLADLRFQAHAARSAAYWVAQNRTYRVTNEEITSRKPSCPRCGTKMRRTTYKMQEGQKHRLFACPKDLFLIKDTCMIGPTGETVVW